MEHGERRTFERGSFKYMVHNDEEGKVYCTGFAFEGEFVADFPYCLDGDLSEVSIEADMPCEVRIISGRELQALFDSDPKMMLHNVRISKGTPCKKIYMIVKDIMFAHEKRHSWVLKA